MPAAQDHGAGSTPPTVGTTTDLPPVRACLFDMDGLLINTEDLYTLCSDIVLERHGRPRLPWSVKARMMGVPGSANGDTFHEWARLPISREQYQAEQLEQHHIHFPECEPLPGVAALLTHLSGDCRNTRGLPVEIGLASSSSRLNYDMKTSRPATRAVIELIPAAHRVLGDDPRIQTGRGKPAPDIYLVALQSINATRPEGTAEIAPEECLVFEDSVLGVEAGRRAGMRVVWVPHPGLAAELKGKEKEVLAGRTDTLSIGDDEKRGAIDDGWAEQLPSLENFPYERYGIVAPT
ncbi:HAD-like protein [Durotheca rogersii]|uniref:HAD-like protein n=1 Tax=Durotheca rogersii TaxID=419775 RepID=UPI002220B7CD|nr:HAD-like protein [Durotheca rogersii]KAI5865571.1 HAD-like protein [Durotheca rogersii]